MTTTTQYAALIDERDQLRAALRELVYNDSGRYLTGIHGDSDVTDIIKDLLKPESAVAKQEWNGQGLPPVGTTCLAVFTRETATGKGNALVDIKGYAGHAVWMLVAGTHFATEFTNNVHFYPANQATLEDRKLSKTDLHTFGWIMMSCTKVDAYILMGHGLEFYEHPKSWAREWYPHCKLNSAKVSRDNTDQTENLREIHRVGENFYWGPPA